MDSGEIMKTFYLYDGLFFIVTTQYTETSHVHKVFGFLQKKSSTSEASFGILGL